MIWIDIKGYEGVYQISDTGEVKAMAKVVVFRGRKKYLPERIMQLGEDRNGYLRAHLCKDGGSKFYSVHRLVAIHFKENPQNKPCVNHIDRNRKNNNEWNLEWATHRENTHHYRLLMNRDLPIGVTINRKKFQAKYRVGSKIICLGSFDTPELAKSVVDLAISGL